MSSGNQQGGAGDDAPPERPPAAFAADGVDLTAIRWMLGLSPTERLQAAQSLCDLAAAARRDDAQ